MRAVYYLCFGGLIVCGWFVEGSDAALFGKSLSRRRALLGDDDDSSACSPSPAPVKPIPAPGQPTVPPTSSDETSKYSWIIAVVLAVVAAALSNFGLNLQKLAWNKKQKHPDQKKKFKYYWVLGFGGIIAGSVCDFGALAFGAQSVVAPLGSLTLVANIIFAQIMHGEKVTKRDIIVTAFIIFGCVLSVAFASHKNEICDISQLLALYVTSTFGIYAAVVLGIIFTSLFYIRYMERVLQYYGSRSARYQRVLKHHRFSYAALSGIVGAQSVLFAKTVAELFVSSFSGVGVLFAFYGTYLVLLGMFLTISLQIYWLNCGLARWDALYNVPIFQAFWTMCSVIGGGVFYGEFSSFDTLQTLMFPAGVLCTCIGVFFLSQREVSDHSAKAPIGGESLKSPLLAGSSNGGTRLSDYEYEVVFRTRNLGFTVEPAIIHVAKNPKYARVKKIVKVWTVKRVSCTCGINAESHKEACDPPTPTTDADDVEIEGADSPPMEYDPRTSTPQTITLMEEDDSPPRRHGANGHHHDCAELKSLRRGHSIIGIDGDSLIKGNLSYYDVLRRIDNAPRPFTLRFRSPEKLPPAFTSTAPARKEHVSALSPSRRAALGIGEVQIDEINSPSEKWAESLGSEKSLRRRASLRAALNYVEDEEENRKEAITRAHSALQGVSLNPLLDLIHTWNQNAPTAYDDEDGDVVWLDAQDGTEGDGVDGESSLSSSLEEGGADILQEQFSTSYGSTGTHALSTKSPRKGRTKVKPSGGPSERRAHPIASLVANISRWTPDWDRLGIDKVLDRLTGIGSETRPGYNQSSLFPGDQQQSIRTRSMSFSDDMMRRAGTEHHADAAAPRSSTVVRSSAYHQRSVSAHSPLPPVLLSSASSNDKGDGVLDVA